MLPLFRIAGFTRLWSVGAILAAMPLCLSASLITVNFGFSLNGLDGSGQAVYDPSKEGGTTDDFFADPNDGLSSFSATYNGSTYTNTSASLLDGTTLPTVFLPGNETIDHGLTYEFFGFWTVSGTCSGGVTGSGTGIVYNGTCDDATLLGFGRSTEVALFENVTSVQISFTGDSLTYNLGYAPDITEIAGTISGETVAPEPALFPVLILGLASLWFAGRRKAIL
jgi:hypothetical protein